MLPRRPTLIQCRPREEAAPVGYILSFSSGHWLLAMLLSSFDALDVYTRCRERQTNELCPFKFACPFMWVCCAESCLTDCKCSCATCPCRHAKNATILTTRNLPRIVTRGWMRYRGFG
jgi:hypothetical protein